MRKLTINREKPNWGSKKDGIRAAAPVKGREPAPRTDKEMNESRETNTSATERRRSFKEGHGCGTPTPPSRVDKTFLKKFNWKGVKGKCSTMKPERDIGKGNIWEEDQNKGLVCKTASRTITRPLNKNRSCFQGEERGTRGQITAKKPAIMTQGN